MNAFNRIIASLLGVIAIAAGVAIFLVLTGNIQGADMPGEWFAPQLERLQETGGAARVGSYALAVALIVIGAALLWIEAVTIFADGEETVQVMSDEGGSVVLSLSSIRQLAERTMLSYREVQSGSCSVRTGPDGLLIRCRAAMTMGSDVPATSAKVQSSVKDVVERLTGLPVTDVSVRARYHSGRRESVMAR